MAHPFYIIGHNPNTVKEAVEYLSMGANALEPDIHWVPQQARFKVSHSAPSDSDPFLEDYLDELREIVLADKMNGQRFTLALITFDLKPDYNYELAQLWNVIREHFSSHFPEIAYNCTVGSEDDMHFLLNMRDKLLPNEGVGVDEGATAEQVVGTFRSTGMSYTYAKGISLFEFEPLDSLVGPKSFVESIQQGLDLRESEVPNGPSLVYGWCINSVPDMKAYLRLEPMIDGLLTDKTQKLHELITQDPEFRERFITAKPGHNPFKVRHSAPERSVHSSADRQQIRTRV